MSIITTKKSLQCDIKLWELKFNVLTSRKTGLKKPVVEWDDEQYQYTITKDGVTLLRDSIDGLKEMITLEYVYDDRLGHHLIGYNKVSAIDTNEYFKGLENLE